jgi:hypothetical protein
MQNNPLVVVLFFHKASSSDSYCAIRLLRGGRMRPPAGRWRLQWMSTRQTSNASKR